MSDTPPTSAATRKPAVPDWTIMRDEDADGVAMTIPDGMTDPLDALIALVSEDYGGEVASWSKENPVLLAALDDVQIETWRSCTKAWCESEGIDPDGYTSGYWAPSGDGARSIRVVYYRDDAYSLGEEAGQAEKEAQRA